MDWGSVELEPEVTAWLAGLTDDEFGQAAFYIDLLAERGVHLSEPYTKQLKGKLRELRFFIGRQRWRVTYFIAQGRGSSCSPSSPRRDRRSGTKWPARSEQ